MKILYYVLILSIFVSCDLKTSDNTQNDSNKVYIDSLNNAKYSNDTLTRKKIYNEELKKYYEYLSKRNNVSDSFFIEINNNLNIKPKTLTMWWIYNEDCFSDAVFLTFLKMFNSNDKGLYGNDIENRTNNNDYLLIMSLYYYIKSGNKPDDMLLLGEIVEWVIYNYDYKNNKEIEQEVLIIKDNFDIKK